MGHLLARNVVFNQNIFEIENIFMNDALFLAWCRTVASIREHHLIFRGHGSWGQVKVVFFFLIIAPRFRGGSNCLFVLFCFLLFRWMKVFF